MEVYSQCQQKHYPSFGGFKTTITLQIALAGKTSSVNDVRLFYERSIGATCIKEREIRLRRTNHIVFVNRWCVVALATAVVQGQGGTHVGLQVF